MPAAFFRTDKGMHMAENYQLWLDKELAALQTTGRKPRLLLHSCCAPCSSYVLEYLSQYFSITVYYYNPNIAPESEFRRRAEEQKRLIQEMDLPNAVTFLEGPYEPTQFEMLAAGLEDEPEGGHRCAACFRLRLEQAAATAAAQGMDYFTTTLSISPLKNATLLNAIGGELAQTYRVPYLFSDFKKREGYKRSCALSAAYGLYRQDYCGCRFSKAASKK